jgi:hypothetical protein
MMRTAALALWSTVGAVGCAGAAVVLVSTSGPGSAASLQAIDPGAPTRLASSSPTPPDPSSSPAPSKSSQASAASTLPKAGATAGAAAKARVGRPVEVRIASVGITAPVQAVGVDHRGVVAVPEQVNTVGWYRFSAPPGSAAGSTVLVGHVDSARQRAGAFFRLREVGRGDRVVLQLAGGRRLTYQIISRAQLPKASVPLADLFALGGRPRLTLITCGGSFDTAAGSYRDNVVITAVPQ